MVEPLFRAKGKEGDKATAVHVYPDHIMLIRLGSGMRNKGATNRAVPIAHVYSVTQRKSSIGVSTVSINTAGNPIEIQCPHKEAGALCGAVNGILAQMRSAQRPAAVAPGPPIQRPTPMAPAGARQGPVPSALPELPSLVAAPPPAPLTGPPEPVPCGVCRAPASYVENGVCTFCRQPAATDGSQPSSPPPGWWIASDGRWYPPQGSF